VSVDHALRVIEADTGRVVDVVRTADGPYLLDAIDGELRGDLQ
jgi:hypothetical protein